MSRTAFRKRSGACRQIISEKRVISWSLDRKDTRAEEQMHSGRFSASWKSTLETAPRPGRDDSPWRAARFRLECARRRSLLKHGWGSQVVPTREDVTSMTGLGSGRVLSIAVTDIEANIQSCFYVQPQVKRRIAGRRQHGKAMIGLRRSGHRSQAKKQRRVYDISTDHIHPYEACLTESRLHLATQRCTD